MIQVYSDEKKTGGRPAVCNHLATNMNGVMIIWVNCGRGVGGKGGSYNNQISLLVLSVRTVYVTHRTVTLDTIQLKPRLAFAPSYTKGKKRRVQAVNGPKQCNYNPRGLNRQHVKGVMCYFLMIGSQPAIQ